MITTKPLTQLQVAEQALAAAGGDRHVREFWAYRVALAKGGVSEYEPTVSVHLTPEDTRVLLAKFGWVQDERLRWIAPDSYSGPPTRYPLPGQSGGYWCWCADEALSVALRDLAGWTVPGL